MNMKKQLLFVVTIVLTATFYAQNIPSYVPTDGLVGWWPFNGNANDESGYGNHGTVNGATLTTDRNGKVNSAFSFDGSSNSIIILDNPILNNEYTTISAWFQTNNSNPGSIIYKTDNSAINEQYACVLNYPNTNEQNWSIKNGGNCNNPGVGWNTSTHNHNVTDNNWHNIIYTYNGTESKIYIDGKLIGSNNFNNGSIDNCGGQINIGKGYNSTYLFKGQLDDIAIFNRALTQEEITALYTGTPITQNLPSYLPKDGLVGYWPFNGNANDESGNENHGTVNGATLTSDKNGEVNKAYYFNGNSMITSHYSSILEISNNRTVSVWFKSIDNSSMNDQGIIGVVSIQKNGHKGYLMYLKSTGEITTCEDNWSSGSNNPPSNGWQFARSNNSNYRNDGSWHHALSLREGDTTKLYIDGKLQNEFTTLIPDFLNSTLTIGYSFFQNQYFKGNIDDIAIYNRALTQEEITALYLGEAYTTPIATITPQSTTSFCSGGSVNINAATNANYTYQWLNNGEPISAATTATYKATTSGKYSVIVKNNSGCIDTSSVVTVNVTPSPSLPILTGPSTLCYNSKAIFKASIAGGTWGVANDYLLMSSPQGLFRNNKMPPSNLYKTGVTYTLKSKNQLCSVTAQKSVWIRNVAATSVTLTASKQTLKVGEEVAATATTKITGNALFWMSASTSFVSVTGVTPYIAIVKGLRPATGANITFSVDDAAKGCRNTAFLPFNVTAAASLVENESNTSSYTTDLNVYPNPSNGIVTLENIGEAKTISLIDVTGRVLKTTPVNADRMRLDYSNITKGNYFISIQGENLKEMKSIVIE